MASKELVGTISLRVPQELRVMLEDRARDLDRPVGWVVREILEQFLAAPAQAKP